MQVKLHTPETIYSPRHVPSWLLLAGAAGFINGFGFLTCQQFVSHVTGTVTRMGLEWRDLVLMAEYSTIFLSFLGGAVAAVVLIRFRARAGGRDRWSTPLVLVAVILAGVSIAGHYGGFGPFGVTLVMDRPPVLLLSLLGFAAGLQNASVASTTGMAVRTTHLTGPTTDIGMLVGAACFSGGDERRAALAGAALRGGMAISFATGAGLSLPMTIWFDYLALLAPTTFVALAVMLSFVPDWSPSDFTFRQGAKHDPSFDSGAGLPADARPT